MREIKFCGKRVDNGEWVYGALLETFDLVFILAPHNGEHGVDYLDNIEEFAFEVTPESVGRFCSDPEIACCKADKELHQLQVENAKLHADIEKINTERDAVIRSLGEAVLSRPKTCKRYSECYQKCYDSMKIMRCVTCNDWQWIGLEVQP